MTPRLLLALLALGLAQPALAGKHQLIGQVQDRNGEPVNRAIISLVPGNVQMMTTREGEFLIDYLRDEDGERVRLKKRTDYVLEIFKPGYHGQTMAIAYKKGTLELPQVTLVEETIEVDETEGNLDPDLYADPTHSAGAAYEGQ